MKHIDTLRVVVKSESKAGEAAGASDEVAAESTAADVAADAAKALLAASARREADMLDLDTVIRDPLKAASLRRHAAAAAAAVTNDASDFAKSKAARTAAEQQAMVAINCGLLNEALDEGNAASALAIAEQLRGFIKTDAALSAKLAADATPEQIASGLAGVELAARAAMAPALARMRSEMITAAGGAAVSGGAKEAVGKKRESGRAHV